MREAQAERQIENGIRQVMGAFRNPIVVFHEAWAETLPEWLKGRIEAERLVQLFLHEEGKATRAEAVAYLYTASLCRPLSEDWTDIYCHLGAAYAHQRGISISPDLASASMTPDQTRELDRLLAWLWRKSTVRPTPKPFRADYDEQLTLFQNLYERR